MEVPSNEFAEGGGGLPPNMFAGKSADKIVRKVSKQLARPNVAGFQSRLDRDDFSALLKNVSAEKIDVLLDEFMVEYGGRRASLIEEMHSEDQVPLRELFYGEPGLMFGIIGEASTGKTSLLLHIQWRLNCRHAKVHQELKTYDTTWGYFQVPDSDEPAAPLMTAAAPLAYHGTAPTTSGSTGVDESATLSSSAPFVPAEPLKCPTRFIGLYVFGSELVRRDVLPNGAFELSTILEAAYSTYLLRLPFGLTPVEHDDYIQAYKTLVLDCASVGVVLLVDGFDFVDHSQRAPLLSSIALTLQTNPTQFFRVFFGSRPNGLFKLEELPDAIIFLCLDRLFSVDWKEKLMAKVAPDVDERLSVLPRDSVECRIHRRLLRSCHSPLLVFLLAQLRRHHWSTSPSTPELTACLYDLFEHFFNLIVRQAKVIRGEPPEVPKAFRIGSFDLNEKDFHSIVDIVVFFYHCWIPETYRRDWSTRERFELLMFYLFKYQHTYLQNTILGRLREHYIQQRQTKLAERDSSSSPTTSSPAPDAAKTDASPQTTSPQQEKPSQSSSASSSTASTPAPSSLTLTTSPTSGSTSTVYDTAYVELANAIWNAVAEWLVSIGVAHRLMSYWRSRTRMSSQAVANQANIISILSSGNLTQERSSSGSATQSNLSPLATSGTSTPSSNNFCFEILLKDEQQVQFQCARFLMNTELSTPILDAIANARQSMRGFDVQYPAIFAWTNYFMTNKHWNYVYDMMASKKGVVWLSKIILSGQNLTIYEWLAQVRLNKGIDKEDLGQIRFYRLLRGFALQQEDRDLNIARQKALTESSDSLNAAPSSLQRHSAPSSEHTSPSNSSSASPTTRRSYDGTATEQISPPVANQAVRTYASTGSASRLTPLPKTAEEVEIANLKEAFGMTFVSILEDNPSAIVHIEKAPVSSLACFSQNAISIILDKMVLLLKQGNIFVVSDLLINLDRHGLINQDIVNKVVEIVSSSKDYKPIRPALRFLSSRTPSHRHLSTIISCLSSKDQDAQTEAVDALTSVAQQAVQQSKEAFDKTVFSGSLPSSPTSSLTHPKEEIPVHTGTSPIVPNNTAFAPLESDPAALTGRPQLPADMVITEGTAPKKPIEELYLMEEEPALSTSTGKLPTTPLKRSHSFGPHYPKFIQFLYDEREWYIVVKSAVSLLVDFVGLEMHKSTKNIAYYNNSYEPRVRLAQCKHLASLVEMMESDESGTRLLPFILLGSTIRSNDFEREAERQQLEAQVQILEAIGKVYTSHSRSSDPEVAHDLIEEMAKNSPSLRGLGYVIHDLLGLQAAKYAVMLEDLIKSKPDLLAALNSWAFARLTAEQRRAIFYSLSLHDKLLVQQSILDLVTNNRALIEIMDPTDLTAVIASNFGQKEAAVALKRAALRFLELSALTTESQDYRLHAIDKIIFLLQRYGFNDPVVTEPLLRILDTIMATPITSHLDAKPQAKWTSSFNTAIPYPEDHPRPSLTPQEHKELYNLLDRNNMRQKLIQALESQSPKRFWVGKVLTCSLLRHFISADSEDALEYVQMLKSAIPEIRAIALSELQRIDASLVPALLQRLKELISYEEPLVRTTYSIVIGSLGLRAELQAMAIDVACYQMGKMDTPDVQQHGVSILSTMGESVSESVLVAERFEKILDAKQTQLLERQVFTIEETGLLLSMVECITKIKLTSTKVLTALLVLLREAPDPALKTAICLSFKRLTPDLQADQKMQCEDLVTVLLQHREGYVREIGIKLLRFFGRDTIKRSASKLIKLISDPELYVRKQAIKAVTCLLNKGDEQARKEALLLLPAVSSALEDKSPLVIVQALKFLVLLRPKSRSVSATLSRLAARVAAAQTSGPDPEDDAQISIDSEGIPVITRINPSRSSSSSTLSSMGSAPGSTGSIPSSPTDDDDDPWYVRKVVIPNIDRISSLLYRRRYRFNLPIKIGVLNCLGTTRLLQPHLSSFSEMLNSENVPTLVEFSDAMRRLGPGLLQYIPSIVNSLKPGSPIVRNLVRLLSRYEKLLDAKTCNRLFSLQTILSMMKNKDANVRKVAVSLMGKKVLEKSKYLWVIIQMWGDKNNKVRKEVMEVLGDIGKSNPDYIVQIMNLIDTDSVSSVLVWRFLSKSWGILIRYIPPNGSDESTI